MRKAEIRLARVAGGLGGFGEACGGGTGRWRCSVEGDKREEEERQGKWCGNKGV